MGECLKVIRVTENWVFILKAFSQFTKFNILIRKTGLMLNFDILKEDFTDRVNRIKKRYL